MNDSIPTTPEQYRAWWEASTDIPYGFCQCGCGECTRISGETDRSRLIFKGEPIRRIHGHGRTIRRNNYTVEDRGYKTFCFIWQGGTQKNNAGFRYGSTTRNGKVMRAHRAFYEDAHGAIPAGHELHHLCEVPLCVNEAHLQPLKSVQHRRIQGTVKLDHRQVVEIKKLLATGDWSCAQLGKCFGVTHGCIRAIRSGRTWKDVTI